MHRTAVPALGPCACDGLVNHQRATENPVKDVFFSAIHTRGAPDAPKTHHVQRVDFLTACLCVGKAFRLRKPGYYVIYPAVEIIVMLAVAVSGNEGLKALFRKKTSK